MFLFVVGALRRKAVDMYHWQLRLRVRFKESFIAMIQTIERTEEINGGSWEIHDEMIDRRGNSDNGRRGNRL